MAVLQVLSPLYSVEQRHINLNSIHVGPPPHCSNIRKNCTINKNRVITYWTMCMYSERSDLNTSAAFITLNIGILGQSTVSCTDWTNIYV